MKSIISSLAAFCLLSACATAPSSQESSSKTNEVAPVAALFSSGVDTSKTHEIGPIACPDKIGAATFETATNYNPKATNVGCSYKGDGVFYTLYAYDQHGVGLANELQGVVNAILVGKKDWKLVYDKETSNSCILQNLLLGALTESLVSGSATDASNGINVAIDPDEPIGEADGFNLGMGVLKNEAIVSIAAVHSRNDMFFKVRATTIYPDGFSEEQLVTDCGLAARAMRTLDASFDAAKIKTNSARDSQI